MITGIFLGSFDPPHIGHLSVVSECLNNGVDQVLIVPAYKNLWKPSQTKYSVRFVMVQEAFRSYRSRVIISSAEKELGSYKDLRELYYDPKDVDKEGVPTYALLRYLKDLNIYPDLRLITTPETFTEISKWINGPEIYRGNKFIIVYSPHFGNKDFNMTEEMLAIHPQKSLDISSTIIREGIKNNRIMYEYLPGKVGNLINRLKLYKT